MESSLGPKAVLGGNDPCLQPQGRIAFTKNAGTQSRATSCAEIRVPSGPKAERRLQHVSIRLDPDVVAKFKATGKGWQSRINEVLKAAKL